MKQNKYVKSVLCVCLGNICRSPTAEAVLDKIAKDNGLKLDVDSAGTMGYHQGKPADPRSSEIASKRGYDMSTIKARQITVKDFAKFDMILAADRSNFNDLLAICPEQYQHKINMMLDFGQNIGMEVPDPYYQGAASFETVLDLIEDSAKALVVGLLS
ncbi:low molecular weight protein-tyrosine-phosphatase [Paraferrimonas sp. SM1919]|uniref:low molecular weight protein-tyrosine-phosphatase n=1 Tax=Paraferrimonas sp. SM1919 TaxID=2662263 RepID=UPI0013D00153|nr:low molecular weight protein-tyrosine-phosphatase [Paraferrimonas sp. SM1919]